MQAVVDGILTHYEVLGKVRKEKLLILHGWKRSLTEWLPTANAFSDKYEVILLDLPGFGQTTQPTTAFSIYDYANFVEHFLDKLAIRDVTLLGHSFGGRIGIILSAKTEGIKKLILVDAAGVEKRKFSAKVKIGIFKFLKVFLPKRLQETLRNSLGSTDYKTAGPLRTTFLKVINEDLSYLLTKITQPTLIIWGEKDAEVELWKTQFMRKYIPHSLFRVVWESGHSPHLEKPREFLEILQENL